MEIFEFAAGDNYQGILADSDNKAEIRVEDQNGILIPLINTLMHEEKLIDEIAFLDEFPSTDVFLLVWNCSPREVIEYLRSVYYRPLPKSNVLSRIYYKYNINGINGPITYEYVFNDNMSFVDDIFIICYLNCLQSQDLNLPGIHHLFFMIKDKYKIVSKEYMMHQSLTRPAVTWSRVMYSFPSVTLLYTAPSSSVWYIHTVNLSVSDLRKRMIWCTVISLVLPKLEEPWVPISCILVIIMELLQILNKISAPFYTKDQLDQILDNIISLWRSKVFPEALKLKLCKKWNIIQRVNEQHNQYKFADYFRQCFFVYSTIIANIVTQERNSGCNFLP